MGITTVINFVVVQGTLLW